MEPEPWYYRSGVRKHLLNLHAIITNSLTKSRCGTLLHIPFCKCPKPGWYMVWGLVCFDETPNLGAKRLFEVIFVKLIRQKTSLFCASRMKELENHFLGGLAKINA